MGLLLESQAGEFASTAATQASRTARLWASSPNSVKAKEWGHSSPCFFGLLLTDFFTGSPFAVELELDLSLKIQLLDVVILRRGPGPFVERLPDGLEDLAAYNLITFKSHQEALDAWALKELLGHYVNYRKKISPSLKALLPEEQFRLYAVCSRYPHNLASAVTLEPMKPGVYTCRWGVDVIRVVVTRQLAPAPHNAPLHLFSGAAELVQFGQGHYRPRSADTSTLLQQLFAGYQGEGFAMPYTMADFRRDYAKEHFKDLTPQEKQEVLQGLSTEERLAGLSAEEIERFLQRLKQGPAAPPSATSE